MSISNDSDGNFLRAVTRAMEQQHIEAFLRGLIGRLSSEDVAQLVREVIQRGVTTSLLRDVLTESSYDGRGNQTLLQEVAKQALQELLHQEEFKALLKELIAQAITSQLKSLNCTISVGRYG